MVEMSYQREANVLGADYFERQGWHPPKEKMSKQQKNSAFVKMLKEFSKVFGRVSFRERLMLRTAFTYVIEEIKVDLEKENRLLGERCNQLLKDKGELTDKIEKMKCCGNCNGIIEGGIRTKKCKICMSGKDLSQWELKND